MRLIALTLLLAGCATQWNPHKNGATQRTHAEVMVSLSKEDRVPASPSPELNAKLADLRRLKPAKFEVYVFPKVTDQHTKVQSKPDVYLGKPRAFEVSVIAVNPCRSFIQNALFGTLQPSKVFPAELADKGQDCAIVEITDKYLRTTGKGNLKQNDVLMTRLFIDDQYVVHGTDLKIYESPSSNRNVRMVNTEKTAMSSGLSLFPVNLTSEKASFMATDVAPQFAKQLDGVALHQIRKRHMKNFNAPTCNGGILNYKDDLGSQVKVGWCKGLPWPSYSENSHFFSVAQPLSVGGR